MIRIVLSVIAGFMIANLTIYGVEAIISAIYGPPDYTRPDAIALMPLAAKVAVVFGWMIGAFAGAFVAFLIGRSNWTGWIIAGLVAAGGIANATMIDHPLWMSLAAVAFPFIGALFAFGGARRWRAAELRLSR